MRCSCNEFQTTRIDESYPDRFLINVQKQQMYYRHGATNLRICWFYKLLNRFETDVLRIRTVSKILPYLCFLTFVDKAISQQFSECFWLYLWENCTFNIAGYSKLFQVDSSPNADDKFHPPKKLHVWLYFLSRRSNMLYFYKPVWYHGTLQSSPRCPLWEKRDTTIT